MNMKTTKLLLPGIFVLLLGFFNSCILLGPSIKGNGNVIEEERNVGEFDEIKVTRGMNAWITQGEPTRVTVVADENLHEAILTETEGSTLKISTNARIRWAKEKKVLITVKDLEKITSTAGSNVFSNGTLSFEDLCVSTSAGSNATLEVYSRNLQVKSSSGSNAIITGKGYDVNLDASSGANIKAEGLKAALCDAEASSGANVFIYVEKKINAKASSGGNIFYYGNPEKKNTSTSSGGNVISKQ